MTPETYQAWYSSPRGAWMGAAEYRILAALLRPEASLSILDVGCGTGHFTRLFAANKAGRTVGLDPDEERIVYAAKHTTAGEQYLAARGESLPFPDGSFDYTISVAAIPFIADEKQALREIVRVTRRRFVLGLFNRNSILYWQERWSGEEGGYKSMRWHTPGEVRRLLESVPLKNVRIRTAIAVPVGARLGKTVECFWTKRLPLGGFIAASGDI